MAANSKMTKAQLLEELQAARERVAHLEERIGELQGQDSEDVPLARKAAIRDRINRIFLTVAGVDLFESVLDVLRQEFQSPYGYFGYVDQQQNLVCPTMSREVWSVCQIPDKNIVFPRDCWGGIWGRSLLEKKSMLDNGPLNLPEGHLQLRRVLVAPLVYMDQLLGQFVLADKETPYTESELELLDSIAMMTAPLLRALLAEGREQEARRQAEIELRQSQRIVASVMNLAEDRIFLIEPDGVIVMANKATAELFGKTPEELAGVNVYDLLSEELAASRRRMVEKVLRHGQMVRFVDERGDRIIDQIVKPVKNDAGEVSQLAVFARDITDIRRTQEALQKSEGFCQGIIDASPDCIKVLDPQGRLLYVSPGGQQMLGVEDVSPLLQRDYLDFWKKSPYEAAAASCLEACRRGESSHFEAFLPTFKDEPRWWYATTTPILDPQGELDRILVISRDVTGMKQVQEELRRAKEAAEASSHAKSEFMANVSHELRTPFNGILGMLQLLLEAGLTPEQQEMVRATEKSSQQLLVLINDILALSRFEAGASSHRLETFELQDLLESVFDVFKPQLDEKGVVVRLELAPSVHGPLQGDASRLRQILFNLAGNAVKFTRQGEIVVRAKAAPSQSHEGRLRLRCSVVDTGVGIAADKLDRVFEPFIQAEGGLTRKYGGAGLGLSIVKRFVELLGGEVYLESDQGRGTSVHFSVLVSPPS